MNAKTILLGIALTLAALPSAAAVAVDVHGNLDDGLCVVVHTDGVGGPDERKACGPGLPPLPSHEPGECGIETRVCQLLYELER